MNPISGLIPSPHRLLAIIRLQTDIARSSLDLGKIMDVITHRVMELTGGGGAVLEMAEKDDMVYRATAGSAEKFLGFRIKREGSLSGLCMNATRPLYCEDIETDPRVNKEACRVVNARSMIVAPLQGRKNVVGVLKVMAPHPKAFSEEDTQTLKLMSDLIGAAISNATEHERVEAENNELFQRATRDTLTGLSNRSLFYDRVRQQIAVSKRDQKRIGILMVDMNGLKTLNDTVGHHAGDAALKELGSRITNATRTTDTVARLGGDEFAVILPSIYDRAGAEQSRKRVMEFISAPFVFDGQTYPLSASIGIAIYPDDGEEIGLLLEKADAEMYERKRAFKAGK